MKASQAFRRIRPDVRQQGSGQAVAVIGAVYSEVTVA